jgi:hypothetical protein
MRLSSKGSLSRLWILLPALTSVGCGEDDAGTPDDPSVVADTYAVTSGKRLVFFDRASGDIRSSSGITGLGADEEVVGIDFRPSDAELYALSTSGKLYMVDTASGEATLKSTLIADSADTTAPFEGLDGDVFGVNFNPVADRLRVVSNDGQNLRINVDTGATTTDAALNPGTPSVTAAAYSNSFLAACRTRLYVIDTSTNKLLLQDPPNAGTLAEIGDLAAPDSDASWAGFEVITSRDGENQALALLPGDAGTVLYDLDLSTAALDNPRTLSLPGGESLRGLSAAPPDRAPPQAPGDMLGISVSNRLLSFNRGAPGKLCTRVPIEGLDANEQVLGIDIRPADGSLYALGSAGKLYTLDVVTGEATLKSTLTADANDMTAPFTSLSGSDFGLGFNPVPDRLRAVSRDGQNLRINVDTGATTTDAPLSPASMAVPAVAYTNAYAGATTTTLYAIDIAAGDLALIGGNPATGGACPDDTDNPNCGLVTSLGPLGVADMTDVDGFDIDGDPAAAVAGYLALGIGTAASSSLYVVDLETGAASVPTGVANPTIGGGEALRGLSLAGNPVVPPAP